MKQHYYVGDIGNTVTPGPVAAVEVSRGAGRRHYKLRCQACGETYEDDGRRLDCAGAHAPALLTADYDGREFEPDAGAEGIFRYRRWLPALGAVRGSALPAVYHSERLSRLTRLPNLYVAFNGYWPEKGARLETATFKDLEAYTALARLPQTDDVLIVSSAGNTAAAFARACSLNNRRCLIVVPECGLERMQFTEPVAPCVKIVSLVGFADYFDAISLANRVARVAGFLSEGGVKNVARRDGLGLTMLVAAEALGRLPDYYFQAVGSGAGGIAVNEAARRLVADGRFGDALPRLMLSQNLPFAPIYLSWKSGRRDLIPAEPEEGKRQILQIAAYVLSNRQPPYATRGGVYDVLTETGGDMLAADNSETLSASRLFAEAEGVEIDPAAGVAFASLLKEANCGRIPRDAYVLLNVTGGGWGARAAGKNFCPARPDLQVNESEVHSEQVVEKIVALFA
ncbi:MAG: cysteate synthase [Pyrinomonadaceae bacterium]